MAGMASLTLESWDAISVNKCWHFRHKKSDNLLLHLFMIYFNMALEIFS